MTRRYTFVLHKDGLELESLSLLLLITTKFEVLASLQCELELSLALGAFETENDLLGGLSLLVENLLGLTTITSLLTVVSSLTLGIEGSLTGLVLGDLVLSVLSALLALAVGSSSLWNVHYTQILLILNPSTCHSFRESAYPFLLTVESVAGDVFTLTNLGVGNLRVLLSPNRCSHLHQRNPQNEKFVTVFRRRCALNAHTVVAYVLQTDNQQGRLLLVIDLYGSFEGGGDDATSRDNGTLKRHKVLFRFVGCK